MEERNKTFGPEKCVRMLEKEKSHLLALGTSLSSESLLESWSGEAQAFFLFLKRQNHQLVSRPGV